MSDPGWRIANLEYSEEGIRVELRERSGETRQVTITAGILAAVARTGPALYDGQPQRKGGHP